MNRRAFFLLALSLLFSLKAFTQYFQSTNFREGSGLPSSESYMVFQDSKGFIWIGTDNGVVKYDGHEFVTYNISRGLTDNTVFGFTEDHAGRIWFRTYNGALSYYENDTIKSYQYNNQLKSIINSNILLHIYPDSLGQLYFSTTLHSLGGKVDSTGNVSLFLKLIDDGNFIRYVDDQILVGVSGLPRNITTIRINETKFPVELDDPLVQSLPLIMTAKWMGKLYFSIHKNLFVYDGTTIRKVHTSRNPFIALYVDRQDRLWVGCFNDGVEVFEDTTMKKSFRLESLADLSVSSILQDREDGMWLSTLDQGVFYFPNLTVQNYQFPNKTRISAVVQVADQVYIGNYDGEVFSLKEDGTTKVIHHGAPPINNLFVDRQGSLWISDASGTYILQNRVRKGEVGKGGAVFKGVMDFGNYIMAYNSMGIFKLSLNGDVLEKLEAKKQPTAMVLAGDDIFLGGTHGLEILNIDFTKPPVKITESRVSSLISPDPNYVMVGTTGEGLHLYHRASRKLTPIPIADVTNIYSIISDWEQRRLWVGTEKGLFELNFSREPELLVERFSKAAGLISTKINSVCRIGNNIWAISDLGISSVPLEHFTERDYVPSFYVSRILFKNQLVTGNTSQVRTQERNMVIDIRGITFKGNPMFFRYRLNEGQPWRAVSAGSIFLSGLTPGDYHMEIQASSGNDNWTNSLPLSIAVLAAWWETWTFRISVVVAITLLGYLAYWLRIRAIRGKHKYLELINMHQQKLIASEIRTQERERKRIATDLHDGIGASLSSIKIQIADAISRQEEDISTRGQEINENLTDVIDDIKRIVYDLHPPALERYGLQAGLKSLIDRLNKTGEVKVIFDYYGKKEVVQPVSTTIFRILQELINNTLKHARASEIRIHINEFDDEINIMYEDNGIGMVGSNFNGLGMHSIESRVRSLDGRMSWESNHKGTFYNFDIPF
jgi:ligand-binding sensor domain-containing protein/two-component sensor histidine kinase